MAAEQGLAVDEQAFRSLMQEQKDRARADAKAKKGGHADIEVYQDQLATVHGSGATVFRGYDELQVASEVQAIIKDGVSIPVASVGDTVEVVLKETPFYAESGGQDADTGVIRGAHGTLNVIDVQKPDQGPRRAHRRRSKRARSRPATRSPRRSTASTAATPRARTRRRTSFTPRIHQVLGKRREPGRLVQQARLHAPRLLVAPRRERGRARGHRGHRQPRDPREPARADHRHGPRGGEGAWARWRCSARSTATACASSRSAARSRANCARAPTSARPREIGLLSVTGEGSVGSGARRIEALVGADAFKHLAAERAIVSELT